MIIAINLRKLLPGDIIVHKYGVTLVVEVETAETLVFSLRQQVCYKADNIIWAKSPIGYRDGKPFNLPRIIK